ncbi:MAG TPA: hypothetical protein HPP87_13200 [Planctomycetes bacterium]|nr:hypothetical protein [Planctomycetota bacterium]
MTKTYEVGDIDIGYHPAGYRIDKTASPMNLYTKWKVTDDGRWHSPRPVDFAELPQNEWIKAERFDWSDKV